MNTPTAVIGSKVKLINDDGIEVLNEMIVRGRLIKGNKYTVSDVLVSEEGLIFYELKEILLKTTKPMGFGSHRFEVVEEASLKDFKRLHKRK